jgi:uncharacterized protein (TIGR00725 family)
MAERGIMVAVIGARQCDKRIFDLAYQAGRALAVHGYTLICGGLGGVMEASCKGAKSAGGRTIGILPGTDPADANPYIDIPIATGLGAARNLIIIHSARVVLAVDGSYGTLSELAFALQLNKPVVGLETWDVSDKIIQVTTWQDAVDKINALAGVS